MTNIYAEGYRDSAAVAEFYEFLTHLVFDYPGRLFHCPKGIMIELLDCLLCPECERLTHKEKGRVHVIKCKLAIGLNR